VTQPVHAQQTQLRLLFTIPHFCRTTSEPKPSRDVPQYSSVTSDPKRRALVLQSCLNHLTANVCSPHFEFNNSTGVVGAGLDQSPSRWHVTIIICTTQGQHALQHVSLPPEAHHHVVDTPPQELGFACHLEMKRLIEQFDYFCYLEDDILITDPLFFDKQLWFSGQFGDDCMLQPNRYELFRDRYKIYVDGPLPKNLTRPYLVDEEDMEREARFLGMTFSFVRSSNPMSACFFLREAQLRRWTESAIFNDRDSSFLSPLESAQILGPLKLFRIYKPARQNADFLEVIHGDARLTQTSPANAILNRRFGGG
jgi:hypothetical protein